MGRHPHCELRFDADRDLDVSSRHASVMLQDEMYVLRDLGSTNGTFVQGKRLTADHVLAHGDVIQFGKQGPRLEVKILRDRRPGPGGTPAETPAAPRPPRDGDDRPPRRTPPGGKSGKGGNTTVRIRAEVAHQTAHLRRTTVVLLALLVVLAGAYVWQSVAAARRIDAERERLLGRVDSLVEEYNRMQVNVASLQSALDSAAAETDRLRTRISQGGSAEELSSLRQQLSIAQARQRNLASAASVDAVSINDANGDAVVLVVVEFSDGTIQTGSGFAVSSDQSSALVFTNRHVVVGRDGAPARQLGVIFNGSAQNFRADIARLPADPESDLALVRVHVRGGVPVVKGLAPADQPVRTGEPVAMIGFPLGLDMEMGGDWTRVGVSASLTTGIISKSPPERLVILGYGAQGSSGSPVFDRDGSVIGVVYGGQADSDGRIVLAVPVREAWALVGGM
ncbi:MAG: trypsin-like peptidase domain-containing protein [Gemmatimonadales bacterium]